MNNSSDIVRASGQIAKALMEVATALNRIADKIPISKADMVNLASCLREGWDK